MSVYAAHPLVTVCRQAKTGRHVVILCSGPDGIEVGEFDEKADAELHAGRVARAVTSWLGQAAFRAAEVLATVDTPLRSTMPTLDSP